MDKKSLRGSERYVLNWAGKSDAFRALQAPTTLTLVSDRDESVNFDNTNHIFIEGENLEVLKALQKSYYGKVKMIYIDPPYNTGSDSFVYPDRFSESSIKGPLYGAIRYKLALKRLCRSGKGVI